MNTEPKWNCCGCWKLFFQNDMLLVNGGTLDMDEPDWWCHGCLDEEACYDEYCATCWNESREGDTHRVDRKCPMGSASEVVALRKENARLVASCEDMSETIRRLNIQLSNTKKHASRMGKRLGFVTSERDRLINKLANINENWEKWQHEYLAMRDERDRLYRLRLAERPETD